MKQLNLWKVFLIIIYMMDIETNNLKIIYFYFLNKNIIYKINIINHKLQYIYIINYTIILSSSILTIGFFIF